MVVKYPSLFYDMQDVCAGVKYPSLLYDMQDVCNQETCWCSINSLILILFVQNVWFHEIQWLNVVLGILLIIDSQRQAKLSHGDS